MYFIMDTYQQALTRFHMSSVSFIIVILVQKLDAHRSLKDKAKPNANLLWCYKWNSLPSNLQDIKSLRHLEISLQRYIPTSLVKFI